MPTHQPGPTERGWLSYAERGLSLRTNALPNKSEASVVYYDERGDPTLVPDPKFQDRVVAETRALLSTVPG
jgi:hypothetical protein